MSIFGQTRRRKGSLWVPQHARHWEPWRVANPEDPVPHPPRNMPPEIRKVWDRAYEDSRAYYKSQRAPDPKELGRGTAWRVVNLYWDPTRQWRARNPSQRAYFGYTENQQPVYAGEEPRPVPHPEGAVPSLGKLLEIAWVSADGRLVVQRFREPGLPDLVWDRDQGVLLSFPVVESPTYCDPDLTGLDEAVEMFEIWSEHEAQCKAKVITPDVETIPFGAADSVVYRSDKFDREKSDDPDLRGSTEYIHRFDEGVVVEQTPGHPPPAIVIQGGRLDVISAGIIH